MSLSAAVNRFKSSKHISWKPSGLLQRTLARSVERSGKTLHSGKVSTVKLCPDLAGEGRRFQFRSETLPASIHFAEESPLCTVLRRGGLRVSTIEHLLSALEARGVDNCRIEIESSDPDDCHVEVPIFDGSASEWLEAIEEAGLEIATDRQGYSCERMVAHVVEPVHISKKESFAAAFPSPRTCITYGINFPQVPDIGCQWFSSTGIDASYYADQIASARTFCIYEEVEKMRNAGLIQGGGLENAIVCSVSKGWLNPPLRFHDEPCRHKVLDLIGDLSLLAKAGSQGLPIGHIVVYKGGHSLHTDLARRLWTSF